MKGLLWKDMYAIKPTLKIFMAMLLFCIVLSFYSTDNSFILIFVMVFLGNSTLFQLFQSDKTAGWDKYVLALPISRTKTVMSRYIFACMIIAICVSIASGLLAIRFMINADIEIKEGIYTILAGVASLCVMTSIIFPVSYFYGVDKGRIIFVSFFVILVLFFSIFNIPIMGAASINENEFRLLFGFAFMACVALFIASFFISVFIAKRLKD